MIVYLQHGLSFTNYLTEYMHVSLNVWHGTLWFSNKVCHDYVVSLCLISQSYTCTCISPFVVAYTQWPWVQHPVAMSSTPSGHEFNTQWPWVQHPVAMSSTPSDREFNTQWPWVQHPVTMSSTPSGHEFNTQWPWLQHPVAMSSTPSGHEFNTQWPWLQHPVAMSSTPSGHEFNTQWPWVQHEQDNTQGKTANFI